MMHWQAKGQFGCAHDLWTLPLASSPCRISSIEARNGMEEVIGSIPIRSTNKPNNLADSQKKRDTLSIYVGSHAARRLADVV